MHPLLLLLNAPLQVAVLPGAPTAEAILARHVEALGGAARLQSHRSRRISLHMKGILPIAIPVVVEKQRPSLFRREVSIFWKEQITAYDGTTAWKVDPFAPGKPQPASLSASELRDLLDEVDFDGVLVDAAAKGHKAVYMGTEAVGPRPAHKLRFSFADGRHATVFFDTATFLAVKWQWTQREKGRDQVMETLLSDFRDVEGVRFAFRVEIGPQGATKKLTMLLDKVEVNPPLDASRFRAPTPKT